MAEYIKREDLIERIEKLEWWHCNADGKLISGAPDDLDAFVCYFDVMDAVNDILASDVVERNTFEQVMWERNVALAQLAEIGKGLGEKMDDVVERKRGKWLGRSENDCYPVCSECGRTRLGSSLGFCQKYVPFCEHCGADMRGDDDG